MRRIAVQLSEKERQILAFIRHKGVHSAREINRAHILAALHDHVPDAHLRAVLGVSAMVIWRTRAAYHEKGLDFALQDAPRPGAPRKYPTTAAAEVVALACGLPPAGAKRWTIQLLVAASRQRTGLASLNRESLRQMLKKTS